MITQRLQEQGYLLAAEEKRFVITPEGHDWFCQLGLNMAELKKSRRGVARQCLDWTERTHHLAGPLGVELMHTLYSAGWIVTSAASRSIQMTAKGWLALHHHLAIDKAAFSSHAQM